MRLVVCTLLVAFLVAGCGGESASTPKTSEKSSAPEVAYFVKSDTDAVNKATTAALEAGNVAVDKKNIAACNKASSKGYPAWRACWHALLDPLQASMSGVQTRLAALAEKKNLPEACATQLTAAARSFGGFARQVAGLSAGIDSDDRAAQLRTGRTYVSTIRRIGDSYAKPFQSLTRVCYSPSDLAKIQSSATPSP
ncbi:MAG: hypothetical protein ABWX73_12335 [Marmoricola sp.]